MSGPITKLALKALASGTPKRNLRATTTPIGDFVTMYEETGIGAFPYHNTKKPEDGHPSYRASDTRSAIERRINAFFWTTGNWPQYYAGADTVLFWTDERVSVALSEAGFEVREQNTPATGDVKDGTTEQASEQ